MWFYWYYSWQGWLTWKYHLIKKILYWLHWKLWKWQLLEQPLSLYLDCWLTHWGWVMQICVRKPDHHWYISWFVASLVPRHYLNQCWHIINWTIGRDFQWNSNQNETIFIKENGFENFVCKMAAILYQPQWVKNKYPDIFVTRPWWVNP